MMKLISPMTNYSVKADTVKYIKFDPDDGSADMT